MIKTIQKVTQVVFLLFFIFLIFKGKIQIWMLLFLVGLVSSALFSRYYCGWVCPINTGMRMISTFKEKRNLNTKPIPKVMKQPWVRWLFLILFLLSFIAMTFTKIKLPLLALIFLVGLGLTFIYPEALFHRYICPFGTLLSLPSAFARRTLNISEATCISCGLCERKCPTEAISHVDKHYQIHPRECLLCRTCQENCPVNAITYGRTGPSKRD